MLFWLLYSFPGLIKGVVGAETDSQVHWTKDDQLNSIVPVTKTEKIRIEWVQKAMECQIKKSATTGTHSYITELRDGGIQRQKNEGDNIWMGVFKGPCSKAKSSGGGGGRESPEALMPSPKDEP